MSALSRRLRCFLRGYHVIEEANPRCLYCGKEWK